MTGGVTGSTTTLCGVTEIQIPANLLPADGRFGSGPSKVRAAQLDAL
ncbi:MAG TPA: phosphoserine transaminase, partial [Nocardiopsis listeri]|nr:phosphoserine transaminase [Nocardiopsis listeri]